MSTLTQILCKMQKLRVMSSQVGALTTISNSSRYRWLRKACWEKHESDRSKNAPSIWASWDLWRIFKLLKIHKSSCNLYRSYRKASAETIGSWPQASGMEWILLLKVPRQASIVCHLEKTNLWPRHPSLTKSDLNLLGSRPSVWNLKAEFMKAVTNFFQCNLGVGRSKYFMFSARPCISAGEISKIFFVQYLRKNSNDTCFPSAKKALWWFPNFLNTNFFGANFLAGHCEQVR